MNLGHRVAAIVLHYKHLDDTVRCVSALQDSDHRDLEITVVDNDANPETHRELRRRLDPRVELIATGENLGYAGGNNVGIREALDRRVGFVWIVNPDLIVERDTLSGMMALARRQTDAGCIGSRILLGGSKPARIWFDGGRVDWASGGSATHLNPGVQAALLGSQGDRPVDYVTGASLLIRRSVLEEVGLLPEEYFLYFEETDFCMRARDAGWSSMIATDVVAWHHKRSADKLPTAYYTYYWPRGRALFARRYAGPDIDVQAMPDVVEWFDGWRGNVAAHAPAWLPEFERLFKLGLSDGEAGRTGRRLDIERAEVAA